jgi:hypothetical protein
MQKTLAEQLREEFDLAAPVATWVVLTHIFVLATPLALMWAVFEYSAQMPTPMASPALVLIAAAVYIGATAFEVAQNSADRWYLTEATRSVADLFFNSFMTVAFCLFTIGFSSTVWMTAVAVILTIAYPIAYIKDHPSFRAINGIVVVVACYSLYRVTADPMAFLFMLGNALGVYCILFLMKRRAQWIHGFAALIFGLGFLTWPIAIVNAANGTPISWALAATIVGVTVVIAAAITPFMSKAKETPRIY